MSTDQEVRVHLFEWGDVGDVDQDVHGCAVVELLGDGFRAGLGHRPGLAPELLDMLGEWAAVRVARFLEHGPEPDGWQQRSDGGWQLWARLTAMPSLD